MSKKLALVLFIFVLLTTLMLFGLKFRSDVKASNDHPVHNLDTDKNYTTIQDAIGDAETVDGHTIFVEEGTYYEHVSVGKELTLIGQNRDTTTIDGNGTEVVVEPKTNVTVTNFTIRNGEYGVRIWGGYGFEPVYKGNTIINNKIIDNLYGAILIRAAANNTVTDNVIANNTLFGIHLWHAGNNTLINNTVVNNGHGINFYGNSNDNILRNNNMTDNVYNFGLVLRGETRNFLAISPSKPGIINDVDHSNTVNGKPIYYLVNRSNEQVPSDAGYVWLNNCTNITINGCNLSNNLQGMLLLFTNNASIINNDITNNAYGIYVWVYSNNNTIVGNTLADNLNGIYLGDLSRFTTMRNNSISGGQMNFGVSPDIVRYTKDGSELINDVDTSNTVDGKPIIYWINQHDLQVPENTGYVMLVNSTNIIIEGLNLSNNIQNIFLKASNNTVIVNNSVINSIYGIDIGDYGWFDYNTSTFHRFHSFNTTVKGNTLIDNGVGVRIRSDNSAISNNTLHRNSLGIYLTGTSNSTVSKNLVVASDLNMTDIKIHPDLRVFYYPECPWEYSLELSRLFIGGIIVGGDYDVVYGNTVIDSWVGISTCDDIFQYHGTRNAIFNNNFINNTGFQALNWAKGGNHWDNGYPAGGNYWSNYNGTDFYGGPLRDEIGSDGIGDTSFLACPSPSLVIDSYPLMAPINIFDAGTWEGTSYDITVISNSTISNFQLNKTQKTISFNVTSENGVGLCRVTIPNVIIQEFWQGNYTVLVNGQPTESRNWTDESNTYIYFTYQHSERQVIIIPEFSSLMMLPLFMIATLLTAIVYKRKLGSRLYLQGTG